MRARLALQAAEQTVELREVVLKNKPAELLQVSAKATVPVLVLNNGRVIDESLEIMLWALSQYQAECQSAHEPQQKPPCWLAQEQGFDDQAMMLVKHNDGEFKANLDAYKYADRYPQSAEYYRQQGENFLFLLEQRLTAHRYLMSDQLSLADMAIFPFIRQFAHVDKTWFQQAPYPQLNVWFERLVNSDEFTQIMTKWKPWQADAEPAYFP